MEKIRITGVPEHFNFPWVETVRKQPLAAQGIELVWKDESRGSGAMNTAIRQGEADIALILTESFVKDKVEGNGGKIIGFHVLSPLIWGIHVPAGAGITAINDLENRPFLVSRMGSGSHLMAYLLAKQQGWATDRLVFKAVDNLDGAVKAFENRLPQAFMWEKFTTKPLVDKGLFQRVGEISTPWPCFVMVASEEALRNRGNEVQSIRDLVYRKNRECKENVSKTIQAISKSYQLKKEDVSLWLSQTEWAESAEVMEADLVKTMEILHELALIDQIISVKELVAEGMVKLI